MLKKRQFLTVMSIVVISFLLGTMFDFTVIASGGRGSPWDRVWTAISELQAKTDLIEEELKDMNTMKFVNFSEHDQNKLSKPGIITGTWIPENPNDNAILSLVYYFEYRATAIVEPYEPFHMTLYVLDSGGHMLQDDSHLLQAKELNYQWSPIYGWNNVELSPITNGIFPNQAYYTFVIHCSSIGSVQVMLRNVTTIITVSDGTLASNP